MIKNKKTKFLKKFLKKRKKIKIIYKKKYEFFSKSKLKRSLSVSSRLQLLSKQFIKKGKSKSNFLLLNLIIYAKKKWYYLSNKPFERVVNLILKARFTMILKNTRKGSVIYELPRCLGKKQSVRKAYYWFAKLTKKRKTTTVKNIVAELKYLRQKKGELLKKRKSMHLIVNKNKPFFYLLKKKKKKYKR